MLPSVERDGSRLLVNGVEVDHDGFLSWALDAMSIARSAKSRRDIEVWQACRDEAITACIERENLQHVVYLPSYPYRHGPYPAAVGRTPDGMPRVLRWHSDGWVEVCEPCGWDEVKDGPELVGRVYRGRTWYARGETHNHITEWRLKA
jgi:hypothetical protein